MIQTGKEENLSELMNVIRGLTTCHKIYRRKNSGKIENFNILPKLVIVCPSYQDILELTLFCIY